GGRAGVDHDDQPTGALEGLHELLRGLGRDEVPLVAELVDHGRGAGSGPVVQGHGVSVPGEVAGQVPAHHAEAGHADLRRCLRHVLRVSSVLYSRCPVTATMPLGSPRGVQESRRWRGRRYATGVSRWFGGCCGRSSMVELQPSKLVMRVRFPSPALVIPAQVRGVLSTPLAIVMRHVSGYVPAACPIGRTACPSFSPRSAACPCPPRSPRLVPGSHAGRSGQHVSWNGPCVPSVLEGSRPAPPPSCYRYGADHESAGQAALPSLAP